MKVHKKTLASLWDATIQEGSEPLVNKVVVFFLYFGANYLNMNFKYSSDVFENLHWAVSQSGGQVQGVLKVNGLGNAERFKHHMDRLIICKLFKVEPIQNTVGLR